MTKSSTLENQLVTHFIYSYPEKSIAMLEALSVEDIYKIVVDLEIPTLKKILNSLSPQKASEIFLSFPEEIFRSLFLELDPVRCSYLFNRASKTKQLEKLKVLSESERKELEELGNYPLDSAGYLMDTSIRSFHPGENVKHVIESLRKVKSPFREVFITDNDGVLVGQLPVQDLLFSDDDMNIENIMHKSPPSVNALSPKSEVNEIFETFKSTALPVVHIDGVLLGAIRYSNLVQTAQSEALSKMASLGGASPAEKALSPSLFSVGKRLPWLAINLLTAFIASAVVGVFEGTIAQVTALAVLLPVVAGQSGNTGAQSMAVTMRGLALREVRPRQWAILLFKELRVGFLNGIAIAIFTGVAVFFWSKNLPLGIVMTVAMTGSMIIASIAGAAIPIILTSIGKDPAQSSSVILTTVTDVMGFSSFLGLATLFLSKLT